MIDIRDCAKLKNPERWWFKSYGDREMLHGGKFRVCHTFRITYVHTSKIPGLETNSLTSHLEIAEEEILKHQSPEQFVAKKLRNWVDGLKAQLAKYGIEG